jgi:hypothetical protein
MSNDVAPPSASSIFCVAFHLGEAPAGSPEFGDQAEELEARSE